jgi:tetratricopeptide (TPR) repeat protein
MGLAFLAQLAGLAADSGDIEAHKKLYMTYQRQGQYYDVLTEAQKLMDLSQGADWALFDYALALQGAGMAAAAATEYDRYLLRHPTDLNAISGRAQCWLALGKSREAVETFENLAKQYPLNVAIQLNLANAYADYHDEVAVETTCEKILKMSPTHEQAVQATRMLANARLNHFDFAGALAAGKQLLELDPKQPDAYTFVVRQQLRYDPNPASYKQFVDQAARQLRGQKEPFFTFGSMFDEMARKAGRKKNAAGVIQWLQLSKRNYQLALLALEQPGIKKPLANNDRDWLQVRLSMASNALKVHDFSTALAEANTVLAVDPHSPPALSIKKLCENYLKNDLARRVRDWIHGEP